MPPHWPYFWTVPVAVDVGALLVLVVLDAVELVLVVLVAEVLVVVLDAVEVALDVVDDAVVDVAVAVVVGDGAVPLAVPTNMPRPFVPINTRPYVRRSAAIGPPSAAPKPCAASLICTQFVPASSLRNKPMVPPNAALA